MAQATRERSKRDDSGGSGHGVCSDPLYGRLYTIRGLRRSHSGSLFVGSEITIIGCLVPALLRRTNSALAFDSYHAARLCFPTALHPTKNMNWLVFRDAEAIGIVRISSSLISFLRSLWSAVNVQTYESIPRGVRIYGSSLSSLIMVPAIGKLYGDLSQFQTKVMLSAVTIKGLEIKQPRLEFDLANKSLEFTQEFPLGRIPRETAQIDQCAHFAETEIQISVSGVYIGNASRIQRRESDFVDEPLIQDRVIAEWWDQCKVRG
ncbi:hypothetical protein BKA82DRAFT_4340922 [Pisolithus tinctorius]|nr:hypothetical protein BKA82DRAFT_4340922 [Pisolithus tinctorius]